jgi:hypothetical protein
MHEPPQKDPLYSGSFQPERNKFELFLFVLGRRCKTFHIMTYFGKAEVGKAYVPLFTERVEPPINSTHYTMAMGITDILLLQRQFRTL